MQKLAYSVSLLPFVFLAGCGTTFVAPTPTVPDISGNWQIQSATGAPNPGILLQGSLADSNGAITGEMRFTNLVPGNNCGLPQQPVAFSGTLSRQFVLNMTSAPLASGSVVTVSLSLDPTPHNLAYGSIQVQGGSCVYAASEAVGASYASITGTYAGTAAAVASIQSAPTGNGVTTLTLTQAAAANSDGQYNVTGTLKFVSGVCSDSQTVTGTVSGSSTNIVSAPAAGVSEAMVTTGVSPYGDSLTGADVVFNAGPCHTGLPAYDTYVGTLTRQGM